MARAAQSDRAVAGRKEFMRPLLFVNWCWVNRLFRGLMWLCVIALAVVIMIHLVPSAPAVHHSVQVLPELAHAVNPR
jgi:hypothetical protein